LHGGVTSKELLSNQPNCRQEPGKKRVCKKGVALAGQGGFKKNGHYNKHIGRSYSIVLTKAPGGMKRRSVGERGGVKPKKWKALPRGGIQFKTEPRKNLGVEGRGKNSKGSLQLLPARLTSEYNYRRGPNLVSLEVIL